MGLNKLLQSTLDTLSSEHSISSWSIFQEKNGLISMKIRFHGGDKSLDHDEATHYRTKSARQSARDRERTQRWRQHQQAGRDHHVNNSPPRASPSAPPASTDKRNVDQPTTRVTRSMTLGVDELPTPEITRTDDLSVPTPVLEFSPLPIVDPPSPLLEQSMNKPLSVSPKDPDSDETDAEEDPYMDCSPLDCDGDESFDGCQASDCSYCQPENVNHHYQDYSLCTRPQCRNYFFCRECLEEGAHSRHFRYIKPVK